jgi:hypothetical protein
MSLTLPLSGLLGPAKPWSANTTIESPLLKPWLDYMKQEDMEILEQLPETNGRELFTLLASERTGANWIMNTLDNHPSVCASGDARRPESGFPTDALMPDSLTWLPVCSVQRGCTYAFLRNAVVEIAANETRCGTDQPSRDPLRDHLLRCCNFYRALNGNYTDAAIGRLYIDTIQNEDQNFHGCSCPRGTVVKGLKVTTQWLTPSDFPYALTGKTLLNLEQSALIGTKIIRLKRRNLWAVYKSKFVASQSRTYHVTNPTEKQAQLKQAGQITVNVQDMLYQIDYMKSLEEFGDNWAKDHGSEVLWLEYEDCRDNTTDCFVRIFEFLNVDSFFVSEMSDRFESLFKSLHTDESLDQIKNSGAVKEALAVNGYGDYIALDNYDYLQLLIYDDSETLEEAHQFHEEQGINATIFGPYGYIGEETDYSLKFQAAISLLESMSPEALVVLSDSRDVRVQFQNFHRFEAIDRFRNIFSEITNNFPGAVVASAETHCCASALTHASPGSFYNEDGQRKERSCLSGQSGCEWEGEEKALPWQSYMEKLASRRTPKATSSIYLDASLIAGKAYDIIEFIRKTNIGKMEDDRAVLTDFLYRFPEFILLDCEQKLFGKNRDGLHSIVNSACPFGPGDATRASRKLEIGTSSESALFMQSPRELGCSRNVGSSDIPVFPRWDESGIQLKPILDHLDRVANEEYTIVFPADFGTTPDYMQGPEVPYFIDDKSIWSSRLIHKNIDNTTLQWRTIPTEALFRMAHGLLKVGGLYIESRWGNLLKVLKEGGFPVWTWYVNCYRRHCHRVPCIRLVLFSYFILILS